MPDRTIRSRALIVQPQSRGVVQVAFASGDVITLSARTMVGCVERTAPSSPRTRRAS